jgi:hypothetical protein
VRTDSVAVGSVAITANRIHGTLRGQAFADSDLHAILLRDSHLHFRVSGGFRLILEELF